MTLNKIIQDKRISSFDIESYAGEPDTYLLFIKENCISTWESGNTITDEKPFKYIGDMLKTKGAIVKRK